MVVSSSYDGLCRIWDPSSGQCLKTLIGDTNPAVSFATFSPNGKFILAGTLDSTLRLWNYSQGKCAKTYKGHINERYCMLSSFAVTSGHWVISGSEDHKIYVWDVQTRKVAQRLLGHVGVVLAVDAHPTQDLLASGEVPDGRTARPIVRVWRHQAGQDGPEEASISVCAPPVDSKTSESSSNRSALSKKSAMQLKSLKHKRSSNEKPSQNPSKQKEYDQTPSESTQNYPKVNSKPNSENDIECDQKADDDGDDNAKERSEP